MSNQCERDTGGRRSSAEGVEGVESPEKLCISHITMVSFYAFPVIFIDIVLFEKGHPNQKGGCPDTLDTPLDPPLGMCLRPKQAKLKHSD